MPRHPGYHRRRAERNLKASDAKAIADHFSTQRRRNDAFAAAIQSFCDSTALPGAVALARKFREALEQHGISFTSEDFSLCKTHTEEALAVEGGRSPGQASARLGTPDNPPTQTVFHGSQGR